MKIYSQKDERWANLRIGFCSNTFKTDGCYITSLAMLSGKTPIEVNILLKKNGGFNNGCLVNYSKKTADILGLDFSADKTKPQKYPTIAEVKLSGHQHFIVLEDKKTQIDPFGAIKGKITYKIISYRNFTTKGVNMALVQKLKSNVAKLKTEIKKLKSRLKSKNKRISILKKKIETKIAEYNTLIDSSYEQQDMIRDLDIIWKKRINNREKELRSEWNVLLSEKNDMIKKLQKPSKIKKAWESFLRFFDIIQ